jgi:Enoyl-(Acyl carrier protein) reductase
MNAIAPGSVETEGLHPSSSIGTERTSDTPLRPLGPPEDIARVAVFLASDEAGWIIGERIQVSGGRALPLRAPITLRAAATTHSLQDCHPRVRSERHCARSREPFQPVTKVKEN